MLGTIVNALAIIIGGSVGLFIKGGLKQKYKDIIMQTLALSVMFVGLQSALSGLLNENVEPILYILSLVIGSAIGEKIDIELRLNKLGDSIQKKMGQKAEESNIALGFVTASLVFCVGTMAILGSLESGINGNHSTLFAKSVLDGTFSTIYASTLGIGVLFSAVAVFLYQGAITVAATFIEPYLTVDMIREMSIVGGIMIFSLGLNMMEIKKIKVGNMLPAILIPVIYYLPFVQNLIEKISSLF